MPGHIKKTEGPDPDPAPWLEVLPELKDKLNLMEVPPTTSQELVQYTPRSWNVPS